MINSFDDYAFCKKLILTADPSLYSQVVRASPDEIKKEAAMLSSMAVDYWAKNHSFEPKAGLNQEVLYGARLVPEEVLASFGVPFDMYPALVSPPRDDIVLHGDACGCKSCTQQNHLSSGLEEIEEDVQTEEAPQESFLTAKPRGRRGRKAKREVQQVNT
ncbi:MAG TPA: hypothetical protein V6C65_23305 [Allocoleopsis sp.]